MHPDIQHQIYTAAQAAYQVAWDTAPRSDRRVHSGAVYAEMAGIEEHAADRYRQTVRTKSAELGVHERDYYLANRGAAVIFQPECMADDRDKLIDDILTESEASEQGF